MLVSCRQWAVAASVIVGLLALRPAGRPQTAPVVEEPSAEAADAAAAERPRANRPLPPSETLNYKVEWRLIHAGNAKLVWNNGNGPSGSGFKTDLYLESAGLVSRLYKVNNHYTSSLGKDLCALSSLMKTNEGSRQRETEVTFSAADGKARLVERDLKKGTASRKEIEIPGCVYDVLGALYHLRTMNVALGQTFELPVSDGKKFVKARIEVQERETVKLPSGPEKTMRYEAFLFNDVLYRRKGRLFIWLTDDERRVPVQIRVRLPFYIGTVTLQLDKEKQS